MAFVYLADDTLDSCREYANREISTVSRILKSTASSMMDAGLIEYVSIATPIKDLHWMIWLMTDAALHIGKHLFVCLLGSFSSTILNPC